MKVQKALALLNHARDVMGFGTVDNMLREATFDGDCPAVCARCRDVVDNREPDTCDEACFECGAEELNSVLVLAGLV